jgi:hypothetical protein
VESVGWILLSCVSTVQRNQLSAAGEALMQHEMFEGNRLPLGLAVGVSNAKKALKGTFLWQNTKLINSEGNILSFKNYFVGCTVQPISFG